VLFVCCLCAWGVGKEQGVGKVANARALTLMVGEEACRAPYSRYVPICAFCLIIQSICNCTCVVGRSAALLPYADLVLTGNTRSTLSSTAASLHAAPSHRLDQLADDVYDDR
jgi:hypothetical protein